LSGSATEEDIIVHEELGDYDPSSDYDPFIGALQAPVGRSTHDEFVRALQEHSRPVIERVVDAPGRTRAVVPGSPEPLCE